MRHWRAAPTARARCTHSTAREPATLLRGWRCLRTPQARGRAPAGLEARGEQLHAGFELEALEAAGLHVDNRVAGGAEVLLRLRRSVGLRRGKEVVEGGGAVVRLEVAVARLGANLPGHTVAVSPLAEDAGRALGCKPRCDRSGCELRHKAQAERCIGKGASSAVAALAGRARCTGSMRGRRSGVFTGRGECQCDQVDTGTSVAVCLSEQAHLNPFDVELATCMCCSRCQRDCRCGVTARADALTGSPGVRCDVQSCGSWIYRTEGGRQHDQTVPPHSLCCWM